MKTLLSVSMLLALALSPVVGEEPPAKDGQRKSFYQRFFGPGGASQNAVPDAKEPNKVPPETWPRFPPGQLPAGQSVSEADAPNLPVGSYANEIRYIVGDFTVSASGQRRAVLRYAAKERPVRVVVDYADLASVPILGAKLAVDASRGLLIHRVERNADQELTIYVRDIARAEE
jgi:hypothetical protein